MTDPLFQTGHDGDLYLDYLFFRKKRPEANILTDDFIARIDNRKTGKYSIGHAETPEAALRVARDAIK